MKLLTPELLAKMLYFQVSFQPFIFSSIITQYLKHTEFIVIIPFIRWIAGIVVNNTTATKNLHNHKIPSPSVVSTLVKHSIISAVSASPRLTTDDISAGRGLQFVPGAVDTAATSKEELRAIRKKALEDGGHRKGKQVLALITIMYNYHK